MNRIFGFSRNAVALVGIIVAMILVVLVGLIIMGSAAIRAMAAGGAKVEGVSLLALLVTIIVLLVAIFTVLLVLFWCCCRNHGKRDDMVPPDLLALLMPMIPMLRQLPDRLSTLGVAIYEAGKTIGWIQSNIDTAATALTSAAAGLTNNDFGIPVLRTWQDPAGKWHVDPNPLNAETKYPLRELAGMVGALSTNLAPDLLVPPRAPLAFGGTNVTVARVGADLVTAGKALTQLAVALGATNNPAQNNPPAELLQP